MSESADHQVVLVSSAEFVLKSSPVRRTLEQRLIDDLRFVLRNSGFHDFTTDKVAGRIIVGRISDAMLAARVIARVFGVAYAAPAIRVEGSMDAILNAVLQRAVKSLTVDQSFAIRCHRSSQSMISTRAVEREGGSQILTALAGKKIRVNLDHPDILISVDLSGENAYVYTTRWQGPGGLPLSSDWKMLAVLDSGPQSLFAAYVMMRRGCLTQLLIPCSSSDTHFLSEGQLMLARKIRDFVTRENYPGFILELDKMPQASTIIRPISLEFARKHRFRGVIFADVAGAIAVDSSLIRRSQELAVPIFRPLIGLNEADLKKLGQLFNVEWCHSVGGRGSIESNALVNSLDLESIITEISL